jgi:hypothetical protein
MAPPGRYASILLLALGVAAPAQERLEAKEILRRAVEAQGKLLSEQVRDVTLAFEGDVAENGEVHAVVRTYWYRSGDRSFRVRTRSASVDRASDRGVFGVDGYWERSPSGVAELSPGNRDDRGTIRQIETERGEFERMLRMVLLSRLDAGEWTVALGEREPVRLDRDQPHELRETLGDRDKETYYVLDATREGEPRLRLYVRTGDFTVRKAIEYDPDKPAQVRWVYYFAGFRKDPKLDLLLPRYFSLYRDTPSEGTRDDLNAAKGLPKVTLNSGLKDAELRPAAAG